MSAAEKLKALEGEIDEDGMALETSDAIGLRKLRDALPQIRAVVEAAEQLYAEAATAAPLWDDINAALTALDEALQ